jgi:23S rRNA (guanosine2251-2'-O)-methyltransferase
MHAGLAALANPRRTIHKVLATRNAAARLPEGLANVELQEPSVIDDLLPPGAVHQGLAVKVAPLESSDLDDVCAPPDGRPVVILDQVTDPQNVGAIFRTAAAFGARAIILQDRRSPPLTGTLAKAAAGAVDVVPFVHVVNIARTLEQLEEMGYLTVGLEGEADGDLADIVAGAAQVALVLGAEGKGLRELVSKTCMARARIPIAPAMESLNVSAAAAVALYEARRGR